MYSVTDPNSFSKPAECSYTELSFAIEVDFDKKVVRGTAEYKCRRNPARDADKAPILILDTDALKIFRVFSKSTNEDLVYNLSEPVNGFGSKLEISLSNISEDVFDLSIDYETSPQAGGLQWLSPAQTAGKRQPYMFSQFQAIYARTFLPCQDTPAVKTPYKATVTVPEGLTVLMSAIHLGRAAASDQKVTYEFHQPISIPSYLIAIAIGDLVSKKIGPRSSVWTEKELIDAAFYEFSETENYLTTAERICGDYVWGVYDLLVLPPSFPYGGMENPCLTFVTPTLLAGDRSLTSTIAHEIAHSWTGNLVTNSDWQHFWLNEGHTVFVERKIMGVLHDEMYREFCYIGGWTSLSNDVERYGAGNPLTKLCVNLTGTHPDEAFSSVPYEKGACLLFFLEKLLGGPEVFDGWLRAYLKEFSGKSIDTEQWKGFLYSYFSQQRDVLDTVDWSMWLYTPGMPAVKPNYDTTLFNACKALAERWTTADQLPTTSNEYDSFSPQQKILFLTELLSNPTLSAACVQQLGDLYRLVSSENAEIKFRWLQLCMRSGIEQYIQDAIKFVTSVGRMKYVRPLYRDLYRFEAARQRAIDAFRANRDNMFSVTAKMVADDLHIN